MLDERDGDVDVDGDGKRKQQCWSEGQVVTVVS
jgi:hypothetical protein